MGESLKFYRFSGNVEKHNFENTQLVCGGKYIGKIIKNFVFVVLKQLRYSST
jgi:hypothetical protein